MSFGEETDKERILRYMKVPAKKKLEWLCQMHKLISMLPKEKRSLIRKLRDSR